MPSSSQDFRELYWEAFGMTHDPFSSLSEHYFYPLPDWDEQAQLLEHTTLYNNLFVIVKGPRGSGKTTFMHQLQQRLPVIVSHYQIDGDPDLNPEELLQIISHAFSLPPLDASITPRSEGYSSQLDAMRRAGRHCLLMVDEGHLLPLATLHALFNAIKLQSKNGAYFHVVLFTEPTIGNWQTTLDWQDSEQFLQEIEMPRLDAETSEKYLEHRLRSAGLQGEMPISEEDISSITEEADGLIGEINHLCKNHLLSSRAPKRRSLKMPLLSRTAIGLGVGIMLVVTISLFIWQSIERDNEYDTAEMSVPVRPTRPVQVASNETNTTTDVATPLAPAEPLPDHAAKLIPLEQKPSTPSIQASFIARITTGDLEPKELKSDIPAINKEQFDFKPLPKKVIEKPSVIKAPRQKSKPMVSQGRSIEKSTLASYLQNTFVIQVFATHEKSHAEKFIRQHALTKQSKIHPAKFAGKPGYLVLVGPFTSEQTARVAVAKLPNPIRQLKPWVRAYRSI